MIIDEITSQDSAAVIAVYQEGIDTGQATFETMAPEWAVWDEKHLARPRLAARADGCLVGWAALSPVSARPVYSGVCEVSIYIASSHKGRGFGRELMAALVRASEEAGIWTLQSSVFPENTASIRLHQGAGFRVVGTRERIARQYGVWRDTVLLERRSTVVG